MQWTPKADPFGAISKALRCSRGGEGVGTALCFLSEPGFIARIPKFWALCYWQKNCLHVKQAWLRPSELIQGTFTPKIVFLYVSHRISIAPQGSLRSCSPALLLSVQIPPISCLHLDQCWWPEGQSSTWCLTYDSNMCGVGSERIAVPLP